MAEERSRQILTPAWDSFAMAPLFPLVGPFLSPSPSHPLLSLFLISSPTMKLISFIFFGQVELRGSHIPLFSCFVTIPTSLSFFGLHEYIYMDRIKKNKLISPFSHFPHLVSPNPTELKTWDPPIPRTHVYCLFEVCATVTDTVFNCTYRCLLGSL